VPGKRDWVCSACGQRAAEFADRANVADGARLADGATVAGGQPAARSADGTRLVGGAGLAGRAGLVTGGGDVVARQLRCRNSWCLAPGRPLQAVFSVGNYEGALKRAILTYKYAADLRWARLFGGLLHRFLVRHANWFDEYAVVCPVPSFLGPGGRRSWGHVELFCAELGCLAAGEWPVERLVTKVAETEPMSAKAQPVRRRIAQRLLSEAFVVPEAGGVAGRRVLVIDDVCASGETLLAVAGKLQKAGAAEVAGLVLARASLRPSRYPVPPPTGGDSRGAVEP
jgi:predicted amidophosphoribosyltransferase